MMTGLASRPWLIVPLCAGLHATYAVSFLIDPSVGSITALHLLHNMTGRLMWVALLFVAATSLVPMVVEMRSSRVHLWLWPQQLVLFMMAAAALEAAARGSYPDGIVRPWTFILADQCYAPGLALAHLAATVRNARFS